MNGKVGQEARRIQEDFASEWTLDERDLLRPESHQLWLKHLATSDPEIRPRLHEEFLGSGPLKSLLEDPSITEIIVNGPQEIWFEQRGEFSRLGDQFLSLKTFQDFVDRLCAEIDIKVDLSKPFADGKWQGFRVHLALAPLTHCERHVTLRRISHSPWTLAKLEQLEWAPAKALTILREQLSGGKNILFVGPTGCGKTSVLGACLMELAENERVVILEDTDELPRPNSASTKMLTRSELGPGLPEITLGDLLKQSLRMRPKRLVVGEVRGAEAKDLLLALATGHSGSLGSLHASDARQALLRLEMLVQMGAPQWNLHAIRQLIQLSIDTIVVCEKNAGHRCLEGIYQVAGLESIGFLLDQLA
ncbi:MAG: CpaF family protein [Bdellovibrionales bacterium]